MEREADLIHRILQGCEAVKDRYDLRVPTLRELSLQATTFWAVCTLHRLHEPPDKIQRASSDEIMKAAREFITNRIPSNLVDEFVVKMLNTIDIVYEQSTVGRQLLVYIGSFIPRNLKVLAMPLCLEQVTIAAILTLPLCTNLTELYMEKADQSIITQGILCHVLKYLKNLKAVALPKQCNDSVIAVIGQNCSNLESIVLNDTEVTNAGIAWLLCCRRLHTILMLKTLTSPPGVALLLHGLPYLSVLLYENMADALWYCSMNASVPPKFALKTVTFGACDVLTPGHLELLSQMCPAVEWLSLNTAFAYSLQSLGSLPKLTLFTVNRRGGTIDAHFEDFIRRNGAALKCLQLVESFNMTWARFETLLLLCPNLETLVMGECSLEDFERFEHSCEFLANGPKSKLTNLQMFRTRLTPQQLEHIFAIMPDLARLELGNLDYWDEEQVRDLLLRNERLRTLRVINWLPNDFIPMDRESIRSLNLRLQLDFPDRVLQLDGHFTNTAPPRRNSPQFLLAQYSELTPLMDISRVSPH